MVSFHVDFRVGGIQWQTDGTYTIKITYDGNMEKSIEYEESLPYSNQHHEWNTRINIH